MDKYLHPRKQWDTVPDLFPNFDGGLAKLSSKYLYGYVFYHDVDEICRLQPISLLKLGHVTVQGSMSTT